LVLLDQNDDPAGDWPIVELPQPVPMCMVREVRSSPTHVLIASTYTMVSPQMEFTIVQELAMFSPPDGKAELLGRLRQRWGEPGGQISEVAAYEPFAYGRCDVHVSGRVAFSPERDRWMICVCESADQGIVLERTWQVVQRTDEQIAAAQDLHGVDRDLILDHEPAIGRVRWRPNGHLWVERGGPPCRDGVLGCFDELSADGELLRFVEVVAPDPEIKGRLLLLEDGRFVVLRGFEATDEPSSGLKPEVVLLALDAKR
jgi:hypothetical protein